jgi:hypothetical protein
MDTNDEWGIFQREWHASGIVDIDLFRALNVLLELDDKAIFNDGVLSNEDYATLLCTLEDIAFANDSHSIDTVSGTIRSYI